MLKRNKLTPYLYLFPVATVPSTRGRGSGDPGTIDPQSVIPATTHALHPDSYPDVNRFH